MALRVFAVAAPGLESVVASELAAIPGAKDLVVTKGGVEASGTLETLYRMNLWLRSATRVLVRLGRVRARDFAALVRGTAALPWERFVWGAFSLEVAATAHRCRLYHTGAIAERIRVAVADRLQPPAAKPDAPPLHVVARGEDDVFELSVDSSGELLHRRGYREEAGKAPLRETLAAGLLALAGWDPSTPLVDPACGSGTLVIEAALMALRRPPGAQRSFAFERWPGHRADTWRALVAEAAGRPCSRPTPRLGGHDLDPSAVALAARNAARAGVAEHASFAACDLALAELPAGLEPGLIICNPPYGHRLRGAHGELHDMYRSLARFWRSAPGWRLAVLGTDRRLLRAIGRRPAAVHRLTSGGLPVELHVFDRA